MYEYDYLWPMFDLNIKVGHSDISCSSDIALYLQNYIIWTWYLGIINQFNFWPQNKSRSQYLSFLIQRFWPHVSNTFA